MNVRGRRRTESMSFELVDLKQGTRKWHRWRALGVGASDAPTVMGENPWKSSGELQQEKLSPRHRTVMTDAMERGAALEPIARAYYCDRRGTHVAPACVQNTVYPWMRASLDGIHKNLNQIVEIKCGESTHKNVTRSRSIPSHYYGQLQHILAVTGLEKMDFWCFALNRRSILIEVQRNEWYIKRLIEAEAAFWKLIEPDVERAVARVFGH